MVVVLKDVLMTSLKLTLIVLLIILVPLTETPTRPQQQSISYHEYRDMIADKRDNQ